MNRILKPMIHDAYRHYPQVFHSFAQVSHDCKRSTEALILLTSVDRLFITAYIVRLYRLWITCEFLQDNNKGKNPPDYAFESMYALSTDSA